MKSKTKFLIFIRIHEAAIKDEFTFWDSLGGQGAFAEFVPAGDCFSRLQAKKISLMLHCEGNNFTLKQFDFERWELEVLNLSLGVSYSLSYCTIALPAFPIHNYKLLLVDLKDRILIFLLSLFFPSPKRYLDQCLD